MVRINIQRDGSVTGDTSRIIAYEGQQYSEEILFSYPPIGEEYLKSVKYTWGVTEFENSLDANDTVKLLICGSGIIRAQFLAKHALTGEIHFSSNVFELIVHSSLSTRPNVFSNAYRKGCCPPPPPLSSGNGTGLAEQMVKFGIELAEEEKVRASQDSQIWEAIFQIRNALSSAGINTVDTIATIEDCNNLTQPGEYNLREGSLHTPDGPEACTSPWLIQVKRYTSQVLQTGYSASDGDTRVSYRTGTIINGEATWMDWIPMVHETNVTEV